MFVLLTLSDASPELVIRYIDEDYQVWGTEVWDAQKGRLGGSPFEETDYDEKLKAGG
jgi:hypothetical protein